jgi:NAD(P)H-dependent flavin oxidoreductase YrpB (nitropropane dioxygenase family)
MPAINNSMNYTDLFGSRYPIIAAPMNKVSDLKLAIACHNAGILPSLSLYTYFVIDRLRLDLFDAALKEFKNQTGSNKILVSVLTSDMFNKNVQKILLDNQIELLEIIDDKTIVNGEVWEFFKNEIQSLQESGIKIFLKALTSRNADLLIDGVILKSNAGAGRGIDHLSIDDELKKVQEKYVGLPVVMSGGISTSADVMKYLDLGCIAVAVGTLIAAAEESPISNESKQKMIESTYADVVRFGKANQNALIFKPIAEDDHNNTGSLVQGIKSPDTGILFAGRALNNIKEIRPVKDIINDLIKDLK